MHAAGCERKRTSCWIIDFGAGQGAASVGNTSCDQYRAVVQRGGRVIVPLDEHAASRCECPCRARQSCEVAIAKQEQTQTAREEYADSDERAWPVQRFSVFSS